MKPLIAAIAVALGLAGAPAYGQTWVSILKNTPAEFFDEEDLKLFLDAARRALNDTADNLTVSWENPATHSRGELTLLKSFKWKENDCREVGVHNEAGGRKSSNIVRVCRIQAKWRLVSEEQLKE